MIDCMYYENEECCQSCENHEYCKELYLEAKLLNYDKKHMRIMMATCKRFAKATYRRGTNVRIVCFNGEVLEAYTYKVFKRMLKTIANEHNLYAVMPALEINDSKIII